MRRVLLVVAVANLLGAIAAAVWFFNDGIDQATFRNILVAVSVIYFALSILSRRAH